MVPAVIPNWKLELKSGQIQSIGPVELSVTAMVDLGAHGDLPEGCLRFRLNEETPDRGRDVIFVDGYRFEHFERNPVMPWNHDYGCLPVGTWSDVHVEGKTLIGLAKFVPRDLYAFAWTVYQMYRERILNAVSVGIQPLQWAWNEERGPWCIDYLVHDLLECSAVMIGQHQNALQLSRAKAAGIDIEPLLAECRRLLDEHTDGPLWMPRSVMESMVVAENSRKVFDLAGTAGRRLYGELQQRLSLPAESSSALQRYLLSETEQHTEDKASDNDTAPVPEDTVPVSEDTVLVSEDTVPVSEDTVPESESKAPDHEHTALVTETQSPTTETTDPPASQLALPVVSCEACGQDHATIDVKRRGADGSSWTHWGICPETGDPVYLEVRTVSQIQTPQDTDAVGDLFEQLMTVAEAAVERGAAEALTAITGELSYDD